MNENIDVMRRKVKKYLDKNRYNHTLGVMYTAGALAMRYGADLNRALTAGLLHDCAKCIPNDKKIRMCKKKPHLYHPRRAGQPLPSPRQAGVPSWRQRSTTSGTGPS